MKISGLKDGQKFYLSPRKNTVYRLDTFEKSVAVITSISSGRTFHKPKNTPCYQANELPKNVGKPWDEVEGI